MKINGKNMTVARLMPRGQKADPRLKYLHVSSKGVTAVSTEVTARVSLPTPQPIAASIWPQEKVEEILKQHGGQPLEMVTEQQDGLPAVTGPEYLVPKIEDVIPDASDQKATFTCNAELLAKVLKCACEVTTDADKTVRLRFYGDTLRIDTWREPGQQEFVAVVMGIEYDGSNIPGDLAEGEEPKPEVKPKQGGLALKAAAGRRFK